jgi:hypothetical protein
MNGRESVGVSGLDTAPDNPGAGGDIGELRVEILASLQKLGYAHIKTPLTAEDFDRTAQQLGDITLRTNLTLTHNRSSIVYKPDEITFHQDNPLMNIIGWYCVRQDELDGSMLLIDAGDVADYFTRRELKILSSIDVRYPDPDPDRHNPDRGLFAYLLWPLVTEKTARTDVYYVPWLLAEGYDDEQQRALEKFAAYLRVKEESQLVAIRLSAGESLFIDNNRVLHGRGPIQQDSKRFLKRVWIKQSEQSNARAEGEGAR